MKHGNQGCDKDDGGGRGRDVWYLELVGLILENNDVDAAGGADAGGQGGEDAPELGEGVADEQANVAGVVGLALAEIALKAEEAAAGGAEAVDLEDGRLLPQEDLAPRLELGVEGGDGLIPLDAHQQKRRLRRGHRGDAVREPVRHQELPPFLAHLAQARDVVGRQVRYHIQHLLLR